ncbi:Crp/Fnr family transcriptional regulator [candidate division KSB1 bacterium]
MQTVPHTVHCNECKFRSLLFNNLKGEELEIFNQNRRDLLFKKGETIIKESHEITEFLYLKTGLVKIHKMGMDKNDHIISIAQPLDFVSLLSIFSKSIFEFSITAIEESTVCAINIEFLESLVKSNGIFALDLLNKLSTTYDNIINTRFMLSSKHLRGRIAYIILFFSNKIYHDNKFELPLSRKEIGELINMTTENVIRILSEFRKDGIIGIDGKTIEIQNEEILRKICELG